MSSAPTASVPRPPHDPSPLAAFLSYLIPGLGQIYQGRYGKGVLFMVALLGMFMLGQAMGQWQNVYLPAQREGEQMRARGPAGTWFGLFSRWQYGGQFWIGAAAWPALYHHYTAPPRQVIHPRDEENKEPFWVRYQSEPDEAKVNEFLVNSDKMPDLGWVYTVVAGMLNLLVIYDAYAGPLILGTRPASKDPLAPELQAAKEGAA